ncbi:MCE family protein [Actinoplanes sp. NBRC 103695]|uniref:MCE family protein n=1 Tax=Actinoplanes sp. NBRC 103695 TaxID=3032202 RepID=UPI0024A4AA48|nr:MCE family protein [Actinoplanes sp. NBRC 103695]GLY93898.1 ABC transporter substrate-binding protein [Actinoplanes sp. NBRC 103695]
MSPALPREGRLLAALLAVLIVFTGSLAWLVMRDFGTKRIVAYFSEAVGVYAGSAVRVLGVPVGTITSVKPQGTRVRVGITIDRGIEVPAGALAVVVAPSVVSDRYVQLSPPYTGGTKMANGDEIPADRTATPVELDQLYESLNRLATALGPDGANRDGALSDLLDTGAANLDGNGKALGNSIADLGKATRTLSGSQADLFGTIANLERFTAMLRDSDKQVRTAETQLRDVAGFLADDREELAAALNELATALIQVRDFIKDNRALLKANVDKLAPITETLLSQRASLEEALDVAPLALTNVMGAYNPKTGSFEGRGNLRELTPLPLPAVGGR